MHEFAIARDLVEAACSEARRCRGVRVNRVSVRIGVWRMVDGWLMREAWTIAAKGTLCEDSELLIESVPAQIDCMRCARRFPFEQWRHRCPACGAPGGRPFGGDELELVRLEVELDPAGDSRAELATPPLAGEA